MQMAGTTSQSKGSLLMRPKNAGQRPESPQRASNRDNIANVNIGQGPPAPLRGDSKGPITKGEQSLAQASELEETAGQE